MTKKTREQAALLCALAAVEPAAICEVHMDLYPNGDATEARAVWDVAYPARKAAEALLRHEVPEVDLYRLSCIRAAIMLRNGWSP